MKRVLERVNEEFQNVYTMRREGGAGLSRYRDLLDLRPGFLAVPRGFDARPAFRTGFLAAVFL
jgi:hypothetical protein